MKKLFDLGNRYAAQSTWKDFTLAVAGGIFAATYVPLMSKIFRIAREMMQEKSDVA